MKVALLTAPGLSPFSPPLGLLSLASHLRARNVDVRASDVSIDFLHFCLNPDLIGARRVSPRVLSFFRRAWTPDGFAEGALQDCAETVEMAAEALSSQGDLLAAYCRKTLLPALRRYEPDLIGVSISYTGQAQAAFEMIQAMAREMRTPIVVGGSFFHSLWEGRGTIVPAKDHPAFANLAAFLHPFGILGEGERPLLELCRCIERGESPKDIAGLFYLDGAFAHLNPPGPPMNARELPPIDLSDAPIGRKYLSSRRIAPMMTSRGCYWNRCAFCDHADVLDSSWREADAEAICENLRVYKEDFGVDLVLFCDESMSPRMLRSLSRLLPTRGLRIEFGTMTRLEKALLPLIEPLAWAGCRFLSFGLESASQRMLNLMDKGITVEDAAETLALCRQHHIMTELFIMFGFPTETIVEAAETVRFLETHRDSIHVFRAMPWIPGATSPVARNPHLYAAGTGISRGFAQALVAELARNPLLAGKMIRSASDDLRHEEYHIVRYLEAELVRHLNRCRAGSAPVRCG